MVYEQKFECNLNSILIPGNRRKGDTRQTRWYPWGIQSPHTSTATGGGGGLSLVSSGLNSGKTVGVFHFRGGGVVLGKAQI